MRYRLFIIILIILGGGIGGYIYLNQEVLQSPGIEIEEVDSQNLVEADGISWYQDTAKTFNLAIFSRPLTVLFTTESAQKISEQALLNDFVLAVNGSYFQGSYVESEHAGLLKLGEAIYGELVDDSQLTHVIVYDTVTDDVFFQAVEEVDVTDYEDDGYMLMQTGPLVIKDNEVQTDFINDSANGSGRYLRTLFGYTDDGQRFFLVTRSNFTLTALATQLLEFPIFAGKKLNVINLDGGTSTAMYSQDLEQFNFGESKRLPVVIGVK